MAIAESNKNKVIDKVHECLDKAEDFYGIRFPFPSLKFDMNGKSSGQVQVKGGVTLVVRFNPT